MNLTPSQLSTYKSMWDYRANKMDGWKIDRVERMPDKRLLTEPTITGVFSFTQLAQHRKWVLDKPDVLHDTGDTLFTAGDMARDYLHIHYPKYVAKCTSTQYDRCVRDIGQTPLFCTPLHSFDGVYLDLESCFWNIVRTVGWDVNYCPDRYLLCDPSNDDFPFSSYKMGRNMLVTVGRSNTLPLWNGKETISVYHWSQYKNMLLWRLVSDVLNGIAWEMVHVAKVTYVYTDGYIVSVEYENKAREVLESWGLPYRVKERDGVSLVGRCDVRAAGDYDFAGSPSRRVRSPHFVEKISPVNIQWLKKRFSRRAYDAQSRAQSLQLA